MSEPDKNTMKVKFEQHFLQLATNLIYIFNISGVDFFAAHYMNASPVFFKVLRVLQS